MHAAGRAGTYSVAMAAWANAAGEPPSALLQQLAALARRDLLRFEVDAKPTLAFQVASCDYCCSRGKPCTHPGPCMYILPSTRHIPAL